MSKSMTNDSFGYQAPRVSEITLYAEGLLCGSLHTGETSDLTKDDLGDIWY